MRVREGPVIVRGRHIYPRDVAMVRRVAAERWDEGLPGIAAELCRLWAWRRGDGRPLIDKCRNVLIDLERLGLVALPDWERGTRKRRRRREPDSLSSFDTSPLEGELVDWRPVRLSLVEGEEQGRLWSSLVHHFHPLGDRVVIGEHLEYFAWLDGRPVALLLWGRAALKLAARDRLLGWSRAERRRRLSRIANNYRFLILPWVRIAHLASHVLALNLRRISDDWRQAFGHGLDLLETFVDPDRYDASSYRAANWIPVGLTRGTGRIGPRHHFHGHQKLILLYPLSREFRRRIGRAPPISLDSILAQRASGSMAPLFWQSETATRDGGSAMIVPAPTGPPSTMEPLCGLDAFELDSVVEELQSYHQSFRDVFRRREQWEKMEVYVHGLLSQDVHRRNVERIVLYGPETVPVRTLQSFMTEGSWDAEAVNIRHQQHVADFLGRGDDGMLIVDGSDFAKKGKESAGVQRQYCGATGKIDNCQAGVFLAYASEHGATLIDNTLYLPKSWFTEEQRRKRWPRCRIPESTQFKTKPQLAAEMIRSVHERGQFPVRWVLADEGFGRDTAFLDQIPKDYDYFCEVPADTRVWSDRPKVEKVPNKKGASTRTRLQKGEPEARKLQDLLDHPDLRWEYQVLKEGAKGPITAQVARMRVVEVRGGLPGDEVWAFLRRNVATGEVKYFLSNASAETPLMEMVRACGARWAIEICFRECKDKLGMDHYELRSWSGWHRHMTLVMLTHHFLLLLCHRLKKNPCSDPPTAPDPPGGNPPSQESDRP